MRFHSSTIDESGETHTSRFQCLHKAAVVKIRDTCTGTDMQIKAIGLKFQKKPGIYGQVNFSQGVETIQWEKTSPLYKLCLNNWIVSSRRMNLDPCFILEIKINSEWIKELNVRSITLKFLEKTQVQVFMIMNQVIVSQV